MNNKKITSVLLALTLGVSATCISAEAAGWTDDNMRYELSDGSFAVGLQSVDGIKYYFDEGGKLTGTYTGWTKNLSTGVRNYYNNGKRCAGWRTINGQKYYFFYEGGAAVGDVQIEDKIYVFAENGVFTGITKTPLVYTKNITQVYSADNLPDKIYVYIYYKNKDASFTFIPSPAFCDDALYPHAFSRIERYERGNWREVEINSKYLLETYGRDHKEGLPGRGTYFSDDPEELLEDESFIETALYHDRLIRGKYRVVFSIRGDLEKHFDDMELYSYFTII